MTYKLGFHPAALDEWRRLDKTVASQLQKKLSERLENAIVDSARVSGGADLYEIKLRTVGYRLVYQVQNQQLIVLVLSVGKRDRNAAYKSALFRL